MKKIFDCSFLPFTKKKITSEFFPKLILDWKGLSKMTENSAIKEKMDK